MAFRAHPFLLALMPLGFAVPAVPASAADQFVLEEVIVTARKRQESLQETPVAVTALGATALREAGVRNLSDLNQVAPNIEVQAGNGNAGGIANIYIRGIGQRNTGPNIDSGVGIYIDDVYLGRPDGGLLDINDISSVQVLRGPQGTLFGKNTTGGALVFTTNRPGEEFEGSIEARLGNYDRMDIAGVLNVPLTDTVFTRFSVNSLSRDGYIDNKYDGDEYVDEDRWSAIGQMRWLAGDDITVDLNLNYSDTNQTARPQKCVPVPEVTGWQAVLFDQIYVTPATGRTYDDFCQDAVEAGDNYEVLSDLGGEYNAETAGAGLTLEWELSENLALKNITAWRYTEAAQDDELDHTAIPWLHRTQTVHPDSSNRQTDQYTQELHLVGSAFDDRMQYVTGVYWFSEQTDDNRLVNFLGPFSPAFLNSFGLRSTSGLLEAENDAWAVFSQVEWSFTDNWRTTLGVRYTDEERKLDRRQYNEVDGSTLDANGGPATELFPNSGLWSVAAGFEYNPNFSFIETGADSDKVTDDDTSFMGSIQYLIDESGWLDGGSVYLTYAEGFLSGGVSEAPSGELETFEPEEVENWELGFKLDMANRRLRVNGALFYSDYKNRQLTSIVINPSTGSVAGATINAKSSSITGLELETTWLATPQLELTFNATFNDGDIDEFIDDQLTLADPSMPVAEGCIRADLTFVQVDSCPNDRSNENLPRLPEQTYFLAAQYTISSDYGVFIPRIQGTLKKDVDYCFDSTSCDTGLWLEDEQVDIGARVTWISTDGKWMGALYGSNLTDEDYLIGGSALVESAGVGGFVSTAPRMYGAELKYSF
jgi:iron complex outermembrane receptor protein